MRNTSGGGKGVAAVFAVAGIRTSPDFMRGLTERLIRRLSEQLRLTVGVTRLLFPYGDWNVGAVSQIWRIRRDMLLPMFAYRRSAGANSAKRSVLSALRGKPVDRLILIGHSAGGAVAVQAAANLCGTACVRNIRVIQVGSPKIKVPAPLRDRVHYLYAGIPDGRARDRICSIGSWGGWVRERSGLPRWDSRLHAPGIVEAIPIIGGHRDYFRDQAPYLNETGVSNLEIVLGRIMDAFNMS